MSGARVLGQRLVAEVEVEGFADVLSSLRELVAAKRGSKFFGIKELDALLPTVQVPVAVDQQQRQQQRSDDLWDPERAQEQERAREMTTTRSVKEVKTGGPILEFVSPPTSHHPSGAGKTALIYLIITIAVLPQRFSGVRIYGKNAAVIVIDSSSHFSVTRLSEVMSAFLLTKAKRAGKAVDEALIKNMTGLVKISLMHVHIFRPHSWDSLLSTLKSIPEYLFDFNRHRSINRHIHTLALEDIDTFYWYLRSSSVSTAPAAATSQTNAIQVASLKLTRQLLDLSNSFSCATILTGHSSSPSSFRPFIPTSWPQGIQPTRLAIRRVEVLKFAPAICIEDAERERHQRWEVVQRSRFEVWIIGIGAKDSSGFVFKIAQGIEIEKEEP